MLRVTDSHPEDTPHFLAVDKKKRQVTLTDPAAATNLTTTSTQERGPMVAAPKMFAFDGLYTTEDQQASITIYSILITTHQPTYFIITVFHLSLSYSYCY